MKLFIMTKKSHHMSFENGLIKLVCFVQGHNISKMKIKSIEHGKFKLELIGHLVNNKYWITCKLGTTYQSIAPPIPICNLLCCTQISYMHISVLQQQSVMLFTCLINQIIYKFSVISVILLCVMLHIQHGYMTLLQLKVTYRYTKYM